MNRLNPKSIKIVKGLPPVLSKSDRCAIDTEWFGMDKKRLHRPHGTFACATFCFSEKIAFIVTDINDLAQAFENVDAAVHIYANAKFDITQLRKYIKIPQRKRLWDVMLIEQIMFSGYFSDFSLADLVRRRLDVYLEKDVREQFSPKVAENDAVGQEGASYTLSEEMVEYACIDTLATFLVYQSQRAEIDENDLEIWKEIELPALWTVLSMSGMMVDVEAWTKLYTFNKNDAIAVQMKYMENPEILEEMTLDEAIKKKKFNGINLGSWMQVKKEIEQQGYKIKSTNEDDISPYADKCEFVRDVLEFRGKSKAASTYGSGWIKNGLIECDNRVYSDFHIIGAGTGRFSSSKPNVENIPVRETPEFRKCFIAQKGNVLIDADWSAQEPRIAAYLSKDEQLIEIFKAKKDVYIEAGKLMFGWELTKKDPRRSERMKPTVLGASYGLTEHGMEKKYGVPKEEGKELLDTFFDTFEGMREWKVSQQGIKDCVTTIYGRKFWLNPYLKGSENNALNSPVQGSGGDGIKIAGYRFLNEWGWTDENSPIINFIHDEILLEVSENEKDKAMELLRKVMIEVAEEMHDGIPADVEVHWGYTWHDAHS